MEFFLDLNLNTGSLIHLSNFVGGDFVACAESENTTWIDSLDPKTGSVIAKVPCSQPKDVEAAILAAQDAFPSWSRTSRAQRSSYLRRISELLHEHREILAVWESADQGKPLERARVEVDRAIANFSYFSTYILHEQTAARVIDGANILTHEHRSPRGVFALISPWNMPLYLLTWKIAPCLAFGCTAVAKPSELTSISAYRMSPPSVSCASLKLTLIPVLANLIQKSGLPPGVINIIFGDGPTTGASLVAAPNLAGVSFTGGTATGIAIRQATAHQIAKHLSLELGGKNPTLVFADALRDESSREKAVSIAARAAFENQGEICLCGSRIYVERGVYDEFVEGFVAHVRKTWVLRETVGPLVSKAHYDKVVGYLELARDEGVVFALGDVPSRELQEGEGYFVAPTVLTGVSEGSRLVREEIFGPVVTVGWFESEEEAVRLANDCDYGLAAVVLTADGARVRRVGEQLEAGLIWVNGWLQRDLGTPFGGMKMSGVGREGGEYSRDVFTVVRTVHLPC